MSTRQIDLKALLEQRMGQIEPSGDYRAAIENAERSIPKNLMFDAESTQFKPETKPVLPSGAKRLTVEEAEEFESEINRFIEKALVCGRDYGRVPYGSKPTLFKSGAEKIQVFLGLIARTEITNRIEDYNAGFFSYEVRVYLIDYNGVVRAEGVGICNSREGKYAKNSGYAVMNTIVKMAKKRALVDAVLNVAALSARFTQDVEDGLDGTPKQPDAAVQKKENAKTENAVEPKQDKPKARTGRKATRKQVERLESLMKQSHSSANALNRYVQREYGIADYTAATSAIVSALIQKFEDAAKQG